MTASMEKSGEAGDSPAPKEALLPAADAAGHHGIKAYTGDDRKFQSAGDFLEIPSGAYIDFPYPEIQYSKDAGLGPMIAAFPYPEIQYSKDTGLGPMIAAFPYPESLDLMAISGRFSDLHLGAFKPPVISGEGGDEPAPKQAPLPGGHAAGHLGNTSIVSKSQPVVSPEIKPAFEANIPSSKYAGVAPMIAAGVYHRPAPGSFASLDLMAVADRFSHLHAVDTKLYTFRPPVPRTVPLPVVLQSPLDRRTAALFRNYMKSSLALQQESLNALLDRREDRADKKKLEEERLKLEEEKRQAYLSLEKERKQFEEYKKQFQPKAVSIEEEKKETIQSKIVNNLETADKHLTLFEKVVDVPKRSVQLGKNINENKKIVKKLLEDNKERILRVKQFGRFVLTGSMGFVKEQIKEMVGIGGSGDAGEGFNDAVVSNGGLNSVEGNAAANGAANGALKANGTGNGLKVVNGTVNNGALKVPSTVPKVPSSTAIGDEAVSAVAGATVSTGTAAAADVATTGATISGGATATVSGAKGE